MIDLAIQIVNYKTKKYLAVCLADVVKDLGDSEISYEILILDNASGDDLEELEESYRNKPVKFYYSDKNIGFGSGHNFLSEKAESKFILILNPDLKFTEAKTIEKLLSFAKEGFKKQIAVVGPKLFNEKGVQMWDHGVLFGLWAWLANRVGSSYWYDEKDVADAAWISGAVFMVSREIFEKVGGFDEKFFLYEEEEDLCLRIRRLGYRVVYFPDVEIFHYGSVVASKEIFFQAADRYFLQKHFKKKGWFMYSFIWILYKLMHYINKFFY